jgi:hypothetical protein
MGELADAQDPSQRRGRRLGQQAGEDRLAVLQRRKPFDAKAVSVAA